MSTELFSYRYVPPGFEIVIDLGSGAEHGHTGEIVSPGSKGGIWNLWFNITLSDNPEAWDDEVHAINKMQANLDTLTDDHRLIRAQMAEFCRVHALFPQSIDILCNEIGSARFSTPLRLGCEGRNLLVALGYEDARALSDQRRETLAEYRHSLSRWLTQSSKENAIDFRIYGFLGQPTDNKLSFIDKLVSQIDPEEPSALTLKELCHQQCVDTQGEAALDTPDRPFNCFKCEGSANEIPECPCSYVMFLNAALVCTGTFGETRQLGERFRLYELYAFVQQNILTYAAAINSWLRESTSEEFEWPEGRLYVTSSDSLQIAQKVRSSLGKKDEVKEWLAACLLKTIKNNQRWFKTTELIDRFPEATSWLKETVSR
ncbi:MAG: hypothetical protein JSW16_09050 [Dehalococcoidales bacterium]|nr:MAG: hypothetical protein JSW16_09050 [Dehalococcoidales bacterium]